MSQVAPPPTPQIPAAPAVAPLRVRLLSAGFWSFFGRGAAIGIFFLSDMVLSRALAKSGFATMYMATSLATFIAATASFGADQLLSRVVRQTFYGPNPERTAAAIRACTKLLLVGSVVLACLFLFGLPLLILRTPWLFDDVAQWEALRDLSVGIVVWGCLLAGCNNSAFALQGLDDFRSSVLVGSRRGGLLANAAFFLFSLVAWKLHYITTHALVTAQCVFQAASLLYARVAVRRRIATFAPVQVTDFHNASAEPGLTAKWYFRESLPYFIAVVSQMVIDELDALVVGAFVDDAEIANYAVARRLIRVMNMAFVLFAASMGPFVAELIAKGELRRLEKILRASATFLCVPMLVVFCVYVFAPAMTLRLAFGRSYEDAASTLRLLTLGQVIFVIMGSSGQTLFMAGKQRTLMWCSLTSLALYCGLAPLSILYFGVSGASLTQSAIVAIQSIVVTLLAKRQVGIWTIATFSPSSLREALSALMGRRKAAA